MKMINLKYIINLFKLLIIDNYNNFWKIKLFFKLEINLIVSVMIMIK